MIYPARITLALLSAAVFAKPAMASSQDPALVSAAVQQAVAPMAPGAKITLGPVQGAGFMQACTGPLAVTVTGTQPYEQAAVHCAAPGWTLYVAVTVAASQAVVVTARPVAAGQALAAADLVIAAEPVALYAGRQVFYDPAQISGAVAVMNLPAGTIVTQSNINEPVVVQAGETVAVDVRSGGVDVSINAVADQSGRAGDTILLTNPSSGKRFSAQVTRGGVEISF